MTRASRTLKRLIGPLAGSASLALAFGCVSPPPPIEALDAEEIVIGEDEALRVQQVVILLDASGSMEGFSNRFESIQNLASSFVTGMPEGDYEAGVVTFGGSENLISEIAPFDRDEIDSAVIDRELLGKSSDIPLVLGQVERSLAGRGGNTAVIVFSDGVATRYGRDLGATSSLEAAQQLAARTNGRVCFYTIQSGNDPEGTRLMEGLAAINGCGVHQRMEDLTDAEELKALQQLVFVGQAAPPAVSAPPPPVFVDNDGDGIEDGVDQCPETPQMANVNQEGCWVLDSYTFGVKQSEILESQHEALDKVAEVLKMNPDLRIRIDGHTDSSGTTAFNQTLSEQRAEAVRGYLQNNGIEGDRLETRGFGMSAPVASNDSAEGMARNRRCQLTVLK